MLEFIKNSLRVSGSDFDDEIMSLINAAREDLKTSGIASTVISDTSNSLVKNAIMNYCKSEFGFDNPDSEKFRNAYESLKAKLALVYKKD